LLNVPDFLKKPSASALVSRTKDRVNLHDKFYSAIEAAHPGMINQLELEAHQKAVARKIKASFWRIQILFLSFAAAMPRIMIVG
jgi:hypothetical protein